MENKEEILKKLLNSLLDNRLKRLEKRNIEQEKDLKMEKESYNKQGILLKKLCSIKIEPKKPINKGTNDKSVRRRDKTPNNFRNKIKNSIKNDDKKMTRSKTPNITMRKKRAEPKEKVKNDITKKSKTPAKITKKSQNSKTPSYMQATSSNANINKKNNIKTNLIPKKAKTPDNKNKNNTRKKNQETKSIKNNNKDNNLKVTLLDIKVEDMKEHIPTPEDNKPKIEEMKTEEKEQKEEKLDNKINIEPLIENKIINTISSFLDEQSQFNFFSCNKKLTKYIYEKLLNSLDKLKKENDITSSNTIQDQINSIKLKYTKEELNAEPPTFALSKGTVKAIELLNNGEYHKIFTNKELSPPLNEIILIYRIFFQLLKVNNICDIQDEKLFWLEASDYILNNCNGKLGEFFKESVNNFDFSIENIHEVKKIVGENKDKIKPSTYSKICGTTGLVIFLVKDTLEYLGVLHSAKKNIPSLLLKYSEYIEKIQKKIESYINYIQKFNDKV